MSDLEQRWIEANRAGNALSYKAWLEAKVEELEAERDKFGHALEKIKSFNDHNFSLSDAHIVAKAALLTGERRDGNID